MTCSNCSCGFDFSMIGGNSERLVFEAITQYAGVADLSGCTATFSMCKYSDRFNDNSIQIPNVVLSGNSAIVSFAPEDTIDLRGTYVWQLSIYSADTNKLASFQGNVIISYNINKEF